MVMNAFDTNFDDENEVYAVNTVAHAYSKRPIVIDETRPVRVYLVNVTEFDPINSFHLHGNFFDYYDHGTTLTPTSRTVDTVMQCQAQRGILEFSFAQHEPGLYMFHAHQSEFVELGWMSLFDVRAERRHEPAARSGRCCRSSLIVADRRRVPGEPTRCGRSRLSVPPVEELTVERTVLDGDGIALLVRAGGSEPIRIAQVQVDGAYWPSRRTRRGRCRGWRRRGCALPYPWVQGETHHVVMLSRSRRRLRAHDRRGAADARPAAAWARSGWSASSSASCRWRSGCCSTRRSRPAAAAPSTSRWR